MYIILIIMYQIPQLSVPVHHTGFKWVVAECMREQNRIKKLFEQYTNDYVFYVVCKLDAVELYAANKEENPLQLLIKFDHSIGTLHINNIIGRFNLVGLRQLLNQTEQDRKHNPDKASVRRNYVSAPPPASNS